MWIFQVIPYDYPQVKHFWARYLQMMLCPSSEDPWCQLVPLLVKSDHLLRWHLPDLSIVLILFLPLTSKSFDMIL